jgi:hypothetical protein
MPLHSALTGADLHEPKGADTASNNTVYVSNGAGSGAWTLIDSSNIDSTSIFNTNQFTLHVKINDIGTAENVFVPIPYPCTLTSISSILGGAITTANSTITFTKNSSGSLGTIVVTQAGSAEGDRDALTPVSNNTFVTTDWLRIANDGAATGPQPLGITLNFTRTGT